MSYQIRRALHHDAKGIIATHRRSIRELCQRDYTEAQIAAWSGRDFKEERWHASIDKDMVWVIADTADNIFGFGHLEFPDNKPARLAGLYFAPEVLGFGYGRKIVELMKAECRNKSIFTVDLLATKTAKRFYERMGFVQDGESTQAPMGDQWIECFKMECVLKA